MNNIRKPPNFEARIFESSAPYKMDRLSDNSYLANNRFGGAITDGGVRKLKNLKNGGTDATLISGLGLSGDGATQYSKTGIVPDIGAFTIYHSFEVPVGNTSFRINGYSTTPNRWNFGLNANINQAYFGFGPNATTPLHSVAAGKLALSAWTWDGASSTSDIYIGGVLKGTLDMTSPPTALGELFLLARNNGAGTPELHQLGLQKDFYFIAEHSTQEQIVNHAANPEKTFYYDAEGNVQSGNGYDVTKFKADAAAGKAGWIPMGENASCGGYIQKHGLTVPVNLVVNPEMGSMEGWSEWDAARGTVSSTDDSIQVDNTTGTGDQYAVADLTNLVVGNTSLIIEVGVNTGSSVKTYTIDDLGGLSAVVTKAPIGGYVRIVITDVNVEKIMIGSANTTGIWEITYIKVYPLANSNLVQVVNFADTMTTNSQPVNQGFQSLLVKKDAFGAITGKANPFELEGPEGYVDLNTTVSGSFEIDLMCEVESNTISSLRYLDSAGLTTQRLDLKTSATLGNLDILASIGDADLTYATTAGKHVITLYYDSVAGVSRIYENAVLKAEDLTTSFTGSLNLKWLGDTVMADKVSGSYQKNGLRTDTQRAIDYNILKVRHGL